MSLYAVSDTRLTAIAEAIREKDGGGVATVDEMPDRIRSISGGGRVQLSNNEVSTSVPNAIAFNCPFEPTNVFCAVNRSWSAPTLNYGQSAIIGASVGVHMGTPFAEHTRIAGAQSSGAASIFRVIPEADQNVAISYADGVCTVQLANPSGVYRIGGINSYSIVAWE